MGIGPRAQTSIAMSSVQANETLFLLHHSTKLSRHSSEFLALVWALFSWYNHVNGFRVVYSFLVYRLLRLLLNLYHCIYEWNLSLLSSWCNDLAYRYTKQWWGRRSQWKQVSWRNQPLDKGPGAHEITSSAGIQPFQEQAFRLKAWEMSLLFWHRLLLLTSTFWRSD